MTPRQSVEFVRPYVVQISLWYKYIENGVPSIADTPIGSGFFIDNSGRVITNQHVAEILRDTELQMTFLAAKGIAPEPESLQASLTVGIPFGDSVGPNFTFVGNFNYIPATILSENKFADIAVLKIASGPKLKSPSISPSHCPDGEPVACSGFPIQIPSMVTTFGHIATGYYYDRQEEPPEPPANGDDDPFDAQQYWLRHNEKMRRHKEALDNQHLTLRYIADLRVNPGNSGGPVYRASDGAIIGVARAFLQSDVTHNLDAQILENSGLALVVPMSVVLDFMGIQWRKGEVDSSAPPTSA